MQYSTDEKLDLNERQTQFGQYDMLHPPGGGMLDALQERMKVKQKPR